MTCIDTWRREDHIPAARLGDEARRAGGWIQWEDRTLYLDELSTLTYQELLDLRAYLKARAQAVTHDIETRRAELAAMPADRPIAFDDLRWRIKRQCRLHSHMVRFLAAAKDALKAHPKALPRTERQPLLKAQQAHHNLIQTRLATLTGLNFRRSAQRVLSQEQYQEITDDANRHTVAGMLRWAEGRDDIDMGILRHCLVRFAGGVLQEML